MSAAEAANYRVFRVIKRLTGWYAGQYRQADLLKEKDVDIYGKVVGLNYYESIYSPMATASFVMEDTGGTVGDFKDDFAGTLKDGLPVEGFEEVIFKVTTGNSGSLDWRDKDKRFVITGSPFNIDKPQRQSAYYPMVSINAITSTNKPVKRTYEGKISDVVKQILKDSKLPFSDSNIHETENSIKLVGKNENPLDTILKLCPKSIPVSGDPGYFFFENEEGFNFKSIHDMINEGISSFTGEDGFNTYESGHAENAIESRPNSYARRHTYVYKMGVSPDLSKDTNDYLVLAPPTVRRDQDVMNAIKMGQFNVRICTRNIITGEVTEEIVNLYNNSTDSRTTTLGDEVIDDPNNLQTSDGENSENYCKTYTFVVAGGEDDDDGVSTDVINPAFKYLPKAMMRYSLLHAQLVNIIVPHNGDLNVGEVIRLNIENITADNKVEKEFNEHRSGYYLILHMCHAFTTSNSFTSLTLARDEYGVARKL